MESCCWNSIDSLRQRKFMVFAFELKCKNRMRRCNIRTHTHGRHIAQRYGVSQLAPKANIFIFQYVKIDSDRQKPTIVVYYHIPYVERYSRIEPLSRKRNDKQTTKRKRKKMAIRVVNNQKLCKFLHEANSL